MTKTQVSFGFYGGNTVIFDGRGFVIKMDYGSEIYLEYQEAQSLASLLNKIIFKRRRNDSDKKIQTQKTQKIK